jgi:putative peptidoglycan lipid II flippase
LASFLPSGSITILSYSQRLISAVGGGIFFRPITVALLPRLADAEHAGDRRAVGSLVRRGLRVAITVSLPLTVFTIALASPVIRLVFHRGNFGPHATHLLALTLAVYGTSLVGSGVQRVLLAPFYARLDTRIPLRNTLYGVIVDLVLLGPCVLIFGVHSSNGLIGIAIAYSVTQYFIVGHAWYRLRETVPLKLYALRGFVVRSLIASAASIAVMLILVAVLHLTTLRGRIELLVLTTLAALAGAATLLVGAGLMTARTQRLPLAQSMSWDDQRRRHIGRHRHAPSPRRENSVPPSK